MRNDSTCWTTIQAAATGSMPDREVFASRYEPVVRAYLGARWRGTRMIDCLDDAVQELFVQCFRDDGVLARVDPARPSGFRAFLYGVARNVARDAEKSRLRRHEQQPASEVAFDSLPTDESSLSRVFDRAWAEALLKEAMARLSEQAAARCTPTQLDLLRLCLQDGLPIREIARRWDTDPARLYREFAKVRAAFKNVLMEVMAFHQPGTPAETAQACRELLAFLD